MAEKRGRNAEAAPVTPDERRLSELLAEHALGIARDAGITTLLVQADELRDARAFLKRRLGERVVWLTSDSAAFENPDTDRDHVVQIPSTELTRISQIRLGLFTALLNGHVGLDESILSISGLGGSTRLDTVVVMYPRREFPWLDRRVVRELTEAAPSSVLERVIRVALRFAVEGREGKPIGTVFVIGDPDEIARHCRPLVLNPCKGHARRLRRIHDPAFLESLREYAGLDGSIIVDRSGVVVSAGTYLQARVSRGRVRAGRGARHHAAAGITRVTRSVAVALSESSGSITVFHRGAVALEIENTAPVPARRAGRDA